MINTYIYIPQHALNFSAKIDLISCWKRLTFQKRPIYTPTLVEFLWLVHTHTTVVYLQTRTRTRTRTRSHAHTLATRARTRTRTRACAHFYTHTRTHVPTLSQHTHPHTGTGMPLVTVGLELFAKRDLISCWKRPTCQKKSKIQFVYRHASCDRGSCPPRAYSLVEEEEEEEEAKEEEDEEEEEREREREKEVYWQLIDDWRSVSTMPCSCRVHRLWNNNWLLTNNNWL